MFSQGKLKYNMNYHLTSNVKSGHLEGENAKAKLQNAKGHFMTIHLISQRHFIFPSSWSAGCECETDEER